MGCLKTPLVFAVLAFTGNAADLVLRNGKIITLDTSKPQAEAIAITGDRIVDIGANQAIAKHIGPKTKVIDLQGQLAIPGFIEGHGHFTGVGQFRMNLNLRGAKSWNAIVAMVAAAAKEAKPGTWIIGRGWHQADWEKPPSPNINGFPVHATLSKAAPNNPVMLTHASGHSLFANAAAMKKAGITGSTPDPSGGKIEKDANGEPSGLFEERAQGLIRDAYAKDQAGRTPGERQAELDREIDLAVDECLGKGITTFEDAGSPPEVIERIKQRVPEGKLGLRLWMMMRTANSVIAPDPGRFKIIRMGDNRFTVRAIKRQIDGALGTRGAWMLKPYADLPGWSGLDTEDVNDIAQTARIAIDNGFQLCIHAIGDRANREVLNLYEKVFREHPDKKNLRWRIEHAQHIDPADLPRFAKLGVIAAMQGIHCTSDARYVLARLGPKRAEEGAYMWRSLIDSGAHVGNGTDAPVEDVDPIPGYYASVTRRLKDGTYFYPKQRMTRMEALRSYTIENAYAAFEEDIKGKLKPGYLADITVLSRDILTVPDDDILKTQVVYTIVGGKIMYQRGKPRS